MHEKRHIKKHYNKFYNYVLDNQGIRQFTHHNIYRYTSHKAHVCHCIGYKISKSVGGRAADDEYLISYVTL